MAAARWANSRTASVEAAPSRSTGASNNPPDRPGPADGQDSDSNWSTASTGTASASRLVASAG